MKGDRMKIAKVFLVSMYIQLIVSLVIPVSIFIICGKTGWTAAGVLLLAVFLLVILAVQITGWVGVGLAASTYHGGRYENLKKGWKLLKLGSIPFYILNFLYCFFVWGILVGASRGMLIILVPIPVIITCTLVVQSGCFGVYYVKYLRADRPKEERPSKVHYVLQLISGLDVVSTLCLLRRYKE